jgi:hypothetical protein
MDHFQSLTVTEAYVTVVLTTELLSLRLFGSGHFNKLRPASEQNITAHYETIQTKARGTR